MGLSGRAAAGAVRRTAFEVYARDGSPVAVAGGKTVVREDPRAGVCVCD